VPAECNEADDAEQGQEIAKNAYKLSQPKRTKRLMSQNRLERVRRGRCCSRRSHRFWVEKQAYRNLRSVCCARYRKNLNAKTTEMCIQKYGSARRARRYFLFGQVCRANVFFFSPEVLLESLIVMLR
jgi:hypothetical protein